MYSFVYKEKIYMTQKYPTVYGTYMYYIIQYTNPYRIRPRSDLEAK